MKIEKLEQICNDASPGPWHLCYHLQNHDSDDACGCGYRGGIWGVDEKYMVCEMGSTTVAGEEGLEPLRYNRRQELSNAKFISASSQYMLKLIALAKAVKTIVEWKDIEIGELLKEKLEALEKGDE